MVWLTVTEANELSPDAAQQGRRTCRGRRGRTGRVVVAALVLILVAVLVATYLARRTLAREALISWLASEGLEADAQFQTLGPEGLVVGLRIGPEDAPLLSARRAEVDYRITPPWSDQGLGLTVSRLRLEEPFIRAALSRDGISFGGLDPLVADFRARPTRRDARPPEIIIHDGQVRLTHEGGVSDVDLDARLSEGRLDRLSAAMSATRIQAGELDLSIDNLRLGVVTHGERVTASLTGRLSEGRWEDFSVQSAVISLALAAPYPQRLDDGLGGQVRLTWTTTAEDGRWASSRLRNLKLAGAFDGAADGQLSTLGLAGDGAATLSASGLQGAGVSAGPLALTVQIDGGQWSRSERQATADLTTSLAAADLTRAEARLERLATRLSGAVRMDAGRLSGALAGRVSGTGGWTGLGAPRADDLDVVAAAKRALGDFNFTAPDLRLVLSDAGVSVGVGGEGMRLTTPTGARVTLSPSDAAPLYTAGRGAGVMTLEGGGLPEARLRVFSYQIEDGQASGRVGLDLRTDLGPLVDATVRTEGVVRTAPGGLIYRAATCAPFSVGRIEAGANGAEDLSGQLCPTQRPTVEIAGGDWRVNGRLRAGEGVVPFLQAEVGELAGDLALAGGEAGLRLDLGRATGRIVDTAEPVRFNPLQVRGTAGLAADVWRADLDLLDDDARVATVRLQHQGPSGRGGVDIDTGRVVFAEGGLQPADLSPLAGALGSPATGAARFTGQIDWTPDGVSSRGLVEIEELSFQSPAGALEGLRGEIAFDSLAPLSTAPDQRLVARRIDSLAPLTAPEVSFAIEGDQLQISRGRTTLGGGEVRILPTSVPLGGGTPWRGELVFESVELSDIVEATPFGDRVDLSAKVSGRLPFLFGPNGVQFINGRLAADGPGRLSIRRSALTAVDATGGATRAETDGAADIPLESTDQPNTAVEFAYQAMENLAFDLLDAEVNSLPGGRLGVLFHVRGQHAPPERQEIRLTLGELIRRDFLNRELPLPSGTGVDLTLDTSLNLDQLLADYARARRLDGSDAVQAPSSE